MCFFGDRAFCDLCSLCPERPCTPTLQRCAEMGEIPLPSLLWSPEFSARERVFLRIAKHLAAFPKAGEPAATPAPRSCEVLRPRGDPPRRPPPAGSRRLRARSADPAERGAPAPAPRRRPSPPVASPLPSPRRTGRTLERAAPPPLPGSFFPGFGILLPVPGEGLRGAWEPSANRALASVFSWSLHLGGAVTRRPESALPALEGAPGARRGPRPGGHSAAQRRGTGAAPHSSRRSERGGDRWLPAPGATPGPPTDPARLPCSSPSRRPRLPACPRALSAARASSASTPSRSLRLPDPTPWGARRQHPEHGHRLRRPQLRAELSGAELSASASSFSLPGRARGAASAP